MERHVDLSLLSVRRELSFWLADVSCVCHLKLLNHLIVNYFSKNWHIYEKLRGNSSKLFALFEHYFEILSTFFAIFSGTFLGFTSAIGRGLVP